MGTDDGHANTIDEVHIFSPNEQRAGAGGGGVRCQTFFLFFFPCSADHERDWPPCKVVFFGLATNALNVRNNNNNNSNSLRSSAFLLIIRVKTVISICFVFNGVEC